MSDLRERIRCVGLPVTAAPTTITGTFPLQFNIAMMHSRGYPKLRIKVQLCSGISNHTSPNLICVDYQRCMWLYHHLGIDPATTFKDYSGRPRYLLEERDPITELL